MKKIKPFFKNKLENFSFSDHETGIVFIFFLLVYFVAAFTLMYLYNTGKYCNVLFDMDTRRAFSDMAIRIENHYRVSVHPLFVIINQPIVFILKNIIGNDILAVALFESFLGATAAAIFNKILQKLNIKKILRTLITFTFGIGYSQLFFSAMPETYIEACLFALIGWLFFVSIDFNEEIGKKNYIILFILGLLSLSAILTNYSQFFIMSTVLILFNKKEKNKILKIICLNIIIILFSVAIAQVQQYIWPSAQNYFISHIYGLLHGTDEEFIYMNHKISFQMLANVFKPLFLYNFNISSFSTFSTQIVFKDNIIMNWASVILFVIYAVVSSIFAKKMDIHKNIMKKENLFFVMMNVVLLFNILFHFVYGNSTAFLYVSSFSFALFISIAIILNKAKINNKLYYIGFIVVCILFFFNFSRFLYLFNSENVLIIGSSISKLGIIIIIILIGLFIYKMYRIKSKITIGLLAFVVILIINISLFVIPRYFKNDFPKYYQEKSELYKKQMLDLKGALAVNYVNQEESDFYFFGMAYDKKYVYKDGKLMDIYTDEVIAEYNVIKELIVPNEYIVLIKTEDNVINKIYENEKGLYIEENGKTRTVFEREEEINLPKFEDNPYSEVLRVLHQEVLFNFYELQPTPCVFTYKQNSWYRDAMLMTMVLEKTNNTEIARRWVDRVEDIYDNMRESHESDNLGELLYILYATESDNYSLRDNIIEEIKRIKTDEGTIPSDIDAFVQSYYPTAIAKFALDKYGIDLGLIVPESDDGYARLTWYTDRRVPGTGYLDGKWYPYLSWAEFHYDNTGYLNMFNKFYPLGYESAGDKYVDVYNMIRRGEVSAPHGWASAEMFLFLYTDGHKYSYNIKH